MTKMETPKRECSDFELQSEQSEQLQEPPADLKSETEMLRKLRNSKPYSDYQNGELRI